MRNRKASKDLERRVRARAKDLGGVFMILLSLQQPGKLSRMSWSGSQFEIDGQAISTNRLRRELQSMDERLARAMLALLNKFSTGRIGFAEWKFEMERLVEETNILFAALALGGIFAAVSSVAVYNQISEEKKYLDGFFSDLSRGLYRVKDSESSSVVPDNKKQRPKVLLEHGKRRKTVFLDQLPIKRIKRRALSYIATAWFRFHDHWFDLHVKLGYTEAYRIRRAEESCRTGLEKGVRVEGCLEWSDKWVPIAQMPRLGTLRCKVYCKCFIIFR